MVDPLSPIYSKLWRLQIHEFQGNLKKWCKFVNLQHPIAQNISDLEDQPWKSKLLRMPFSVRLVSLTVLHKNLVKLFFISSRNDD